MRRKPSDYVREHVRFTTQPLEDVNVAMYRDYLEMMDLGDCLMFSTDYPHADCKYPSSLPYFLKLPLSEDSQRKVLWDNFCRLYDFPLDYAS